MIFNSKQLEELENAHDSAGFQDGESDSESKESTNDSALAWRRSMIEEAATHVKRAFARPVDPKLTYEVGSLLFDRDVKRFGRVRRSIPGYLFIAYLTGGEREYGQMDLDAYLKKSASEKTMAELCTALGESEENLEVNLRRLGLSPADVDFEELDAAAAKAAKSAPKTKAAAKTAKGGKKATTKAASKKATSKKASAKKAKATPAKKKASGKNSKGGADPIEDPNSFIKENYQEMSNRELARHTGLSEHTIRRKLGEWRMRRKR